MTGSEFLLNDETGCWHEGRPESSEWKRRAVVNFKGFKYTFPMITRRKTLIGAHLWSKAQGLHTVVNVRRYKYCSPNFEFESAWPLYLGKKQFLCDVHKSLDRWAVSSKMPYRWPRHQQHIFIAPHSILPCRPKFKTTYKNPVSGGFLNQLCPVSGEMAFTGLLNRNTKGQKIKLTISNSLTLINSEFNWTSLNEFLNSTFSL